MQLGMGSDMDGNTFTATEVQFRSIAPRRVDVAIIWNWTTARLTSRDGVSLVKHLLAHLHSPKRLTSGRFRLYSALHYGELYAGFPARRRTYPLSGCI